jgi:DNA-binding NarL/FixJ family response regulator
MTSVAIVDDHKIIADGLEQLINKSETACVTGKAYSVAGCLELLKGNQPEVLLLDVSMPDGNGIDLCPKIKTKYPQVKVLMLTSYGELATITRALDAGADGYVLKNSLPEELLEGICTVASGKRFLCEDVNMTLQKNESNPMELSRREMELLQLNSGRIYPASTSRQNVSGSQYHPRLPPTAEHQTECPQHCSTVAECEGVEVSVTVFTTFFKLPYSVLW